MTTNKPTIFDHYHYQKLIQARGETIRGTVQKLKDAIGLSTALDAGCGLGFFSQILQDLGLSVTAFDGRQENVEEGRRRFPGIAFECGDVQDNGIRQLGEFELVLCFGLLYHLENPLGAIRNLRALTNKVLFLESMCLPQERPWMLLREEPRVEDQSLTDLAFYPSEGCLAKMLYRAGFSCVYRVQDLPNHDDFQDTADHTRRRTVLVATVKESNLPGLIPFPEPKETADPWGLRVGKIAKLGRRVRTFAKKPARKKLITLARRVRKVLPAVPIPLRLPFGAWWLAGESPLDQQLMNGEFESSELLFVQEFLRPGMTVLDIGAHHGLYTLLAAKKVGASGRVIAFEPSPRERGRLSKNVQFNRMTNVQIEACALGATTSRVELYLADYGNDWCNSLKPPVEGAPKTVVVDVCSLDDVIARLALKEIDFLKLDIEGGKLAALKGAAALLASSKRPVILIEVQDLRTEPWGHKALDVVRYLEQANYRWANVVAGGRLQPLDTSQSWYDGNFVAIPAELFARLTEEPKA